MTCCHGMTRNERLERPYDDEFKMARERCARPNARVLAIRPLIGYVPPRMHHHVPRINVNRVQDHVVQTRRFAVSKDEFYDGCGLYTRFGGIRCGGDETTHEACGLNPTCIRRTTADRARVLAQTTTTNGWCTNIDSIGCPYKNTCPIKQMVPFRDRCPVKPKTRCYGLPTSKTKYHAKLDYGVEFWIEDLMVEINAMENESRNLQERTRALENCLDETTRTLENATSTLYDHQLRSVKNIHGFPDQLDEALCKEKKDLFKTRELLDHLLEKAEAQIGRNCNAGHNLATDYAARYQLRTTANSCRVHENLKEQTTHLAFLPGVNRCNQSVITPEYWSSTVRRNVGDSRYERVRSEKLCRQLEQAMSASSNRMWQDAHVTNVALKAVIKEEKNAMVSMTKELEKANDDIDECDLNIQRLQHMINRKEFSRVMTRARADQTRRMQQSSEICHDINLDLMDKDIQTMCEDIGKMTGTMAEFTADRIDKVEKRDDIERTQKAIGDDFLLDSQICEPLRKNLRIKIIDPPVMDRKFEINSACS